MYVFDVPTKDKISSGNMRGQKRVRDLISHWNNMEGRMDEEGTGSKRSSTLPVPNPKPHPLPRPQAQVKTLGNNTNRNKVVSTSKPSLPPKPQPASSSLTNSTSKVAQKPARPHCNRNNNVIQSSSNAGLKNRTLHKISEDDDSITKKIETNGVNKEKESISTGSMEIPKVKNVNGTTKEVNNLRTKPLPPRKPLPDFPGDLDNLERDLEKKPPRPYKPPEIMALANAQKSREEIKKDRRKISAPSLGTTSSPCQSPRNSPLSSPRISRQTLPANFEASVSDSKGLYEVVDAVDSSTALPSSKPTGNRVTVASVVQSESSYKRSASSDNSSASHARERKHNRVLASDIKKSSAGSASERKTKLSPPSLKKETISKAIDKKGSTTSIDKKGSTTSLYKNGKNGSTTSIDKKRSTTSIDKKGSTPSVDKNGSTTSIDKKRSTTSTDKKGSTTSINKIYVSSRKISPSTNKGRNSSPTDKNKITSLSDEKTNKSLPSNEKVTSSSANKESTLTALKSSSTSSLNRRRSNSSDRSKTPSPDVSQQNDNSIPSGARKVELPEMEKGDVHKVESTSFSAPTNEKTASFDSELKPSSSPPSNKKAMLSFDKTKFSIRSSYRKISNSLLPDKQKSISASSESSKTSTFFISDKAAIAKELNQAIGKANSPNLSEKKSSSKEAELPAAKPASLSLSCKNESDANSDSQESTLVSADEKAASSSSGKKKTEKQSRSSKLFSRLTSLSMKPRSVQAEKPLRRSQSAVDASETILDPGQEGDMDDQSKTRKMSPGPILSTLESLCESDEGQELKSRSRYKPISPVQEEPEDHQTRRRANSYDRKPVTGSKHVNSKKALVTSSSLDENSSSMRRSNSLGDMIDPSSTEESEKLQNTTSKKTVALKPNFAKPLRPHSVADISKPVSNSGKSSKVSSQLNSLPVDVNEAQTIDDDIESARSVRNSEVPSAKSGASCKSRPVTVGDFSHFPSYSAKDTSSKVHLKRASLSVDSASLSTKLHAVAVEIPISSDGMNEENKEKNQTDFSVANSELKTSHISGRHKKENIRSDSSTSKPVETDISNRPSGIKDQKKSDSGIIETSDFDNRKAGILPKKTDLIIKKSLAKEEASKAKIPLRPSSLAFKSDKSSSFDDNHGVELEGCLKETELLESASDKPSTADEAKQRARTIGSKTSEKDKEEILDDGHENAGRRYSSGKIKLATRSRRLPPPAGPPPSIPAPKVDLSSPDGSRRPAPPPPEVDEPTEIKRTTDRALPAVPEAPRPRSVYEDSRFRTSPEGSSSSVNNVSEVFTGGGQSRYSYDSSPDLQHRTTTSERSPVSMATETSYEYTGLDMSLVSEMVECMKSKPRIVSTGEYEIMPEGSAGLYAAVNPNNGFISSLNNRQEVTESSGETTTSTISTVTDNEKSRDQSSLDNSSESSDEGSAYIAPHDEWQGAGGESDTDFFTDDSQSSHDYLDPPPSHPPVPTPEGSLSQVKTWEESNQDIFGDENGAEDRTLEEPLYQVYTAATLARERNISRKSVSSDNSESTVEEYTKGTMQNMRMLWCQLPEVVTSGILDRISENERKRQEAMFEVITSEASYIKSLGILINHFMDEPELNPNCEECVLEKSQYRILFCNVKAIKEMSERFLEDLRTRQKEQVLISTISDIIYKFVCKHFDVYVKYCSNQVYQERMVKSLREKNPRFVEVCSKLEKQQVVQSLNLQSFLVLPMQRITRFPLLVDAICHRCEGGSEEFRRTDAALSEVNKVVKDCNEGARKMERMEEMCLLQSQIEFKTKPIALVTSTRYLLRRGDLMFVQEGEYRSPLKKGKLKIKPNLKPTYLFLFSDLVLIAKKKSEKNFKVLDYATRSMTQVENTVHKNIQCNHMFSLIFLENSDGKTKDYLLSASNETDKTRWIVAFKPPTAKEGELAVYDSWDCPQVQAIHNYNAQQPDELTMHEGDVINVLRKLTDGWYHGERLCDCAQGWFPANHTEEILNEHVRRRNLLQRYRLLAASQHLMGTLMSS